MRTRFLKKLKDIRYEEKQGFRDSRTEIAILIDKNQNQSLDARPDLNGSPTSNWRDTQIRPEPNPCAQTAKPEESGGQGDENLLVDEIRRMQSAYPHTLFGRKEFPKQMPVIVVWSAGYCRNWRACPSRDSG